MIVLSLTVFFVTMFIGVPVALAIAGSAFVYYLTNESLPTQLIFQGFIGGLESFPLLAIPFFILAGELMNAAGMTSRLIRLAEAFVGHFTGGLGHANVVANTLMGGLSGSSNADAAAISKTLVPEMVKRGYDRDWSAALTAAGSVIGPIIPPGIGLILFGYLADVSIGKLFIGGIIPGILLCLGLMVAVRITAKRRGYRPSRERMASPKEMWSAFCSAFWALMLPVIIVGGIRFGVFTHTEAAVIAVVYALIVGAFIYREIKWKNVILALVDTVKISSVVMLIVGAASAFGRMLSWERIPHALAEFITGLSSAPFAILLVINLILFFIGCFAEGTANLIIMTPLLMPVVEKLGLDPVAFGVMMVLNLTIGGATPPVGTMMFTVCSLSGVSVSDYTKRVWPFLVALIAVLFLITYVPTLVTFLPNLLMD